MQWNWQTSLKLTAAALLLALVAGDSLARPGDRLFGRSRNNNVDPAYSQYTPVQQQPVQAVQATQPAQPMPAATQPAPVVQQQPAVQQPVVQSETPQYTTTRRGLFGRRTQQVAQTPVQQTAPQTTPAAGTPTNNNNRQSFYPAPAGTQSFIEVRLPVATAEVNFNGTATTQTGASRLFVTPALEAQRENVYKVTARWMDNGNAVEQKREIKVTPGARVVVDFTQAQAQQPQGQQPPAIQTPAEQPAQPQQP